MVNDDDDGDTRVFWRQYTLNSCDSVLNAVTEEQYIIDDVIDLRTRHCI